MKIVPRVRPLNDHHKKIASVVQVTVAYWRLKFVGVFFDPVFQINWRLHRSHNVSVCCPSEASNRSSADTEGGARQAPSSYLDSVDSSVGIPCATMNFPSIAAMDLATFFASLSGSLLLITNGRPAPAESSECDAASRMEKLFT